MRIWGARRSRGLVIGEPQKVCMGRASKSLHAEQMITSWPRNLPANFAFPPKNLHFPGFIQVRISKGMFLLHFQLSAAPACHQAWESEVHTQLNHHPRDAHETPLQVRRTGLCHCVLKLKDFL